MAYYITSPQHSFVKFGQPEGGTLTWLDNQCPGLALPFCLPLVEENDLAFFVYVTADTVQEIDDVCNSSLASDFYLSIRAGESLTTVPASFASAEWRQWTSVQQLNGSKYRVDDYTMAIHIPGPINGLMDDVECEQCMQLGFYFRIPTTTTWVGGISNCFYAECDGCYTSVIQYSSNENEGGFPYCAGPNMYNRVRLPMYFSRPVFPEDESIYVKSNGQRVVTKAVVKKQFTARTDSMPAWAHDAMRAALIHDFLSIESPAYSGDFRKEGPYDIAWEDWMDYPSAQASFKADASPFLLKNNQCEECAEMGYEVTTYDYTIAGTLLPNTPYNINLVPLTNSPCCNPVNLALAYINATYVNLVTAQITTAGMLTFTTTNFSGPSAGITLFTYTGSCGNAISTPGTIFATT